ncbi:hypothetical protein ADK96_07495 [Streptomyces sp. IGB124]|nr:hypothetical protein ADK96_07495 [Streptomyces sp. IGB124]
MPDPVTTVNAMGPTLDFAVKLIDRLRSRARSGRVTYSGGRVPRVARPPVTHTLAPTPSPSPSFLLPPFRRSTL